jgi:hypothetical protein
MKTIELNQFGSTLTDRADGKKALAAIMGQTTPPIALDFAGVISLGSSFGDEIIPKLAANQDNAMVILNANGVIQNSIRRITEDTPIHITFESTPHA